MFARRIAQPLASASRSFANPPRTIASPLPRTALPSVQSTRSYSVPSSTLPTGLDQGEQTIYKKLSETFPGKRLEVQDVSGGCGSFYAILISSPKFNGLSTIKQHKLVNQCLKEDIQGIHGLQLKTIAEEE